MKKNEIKEKLQSYTKEQIIDALLTCDNNFSIMLLRRLDEKLIDKKQKAVDEDAKKWAKAQTEYNEFREQLKEKRRKGEHPSNEDYLLLADLYLKENAAYNDYSCLQDELDMFLRGL